MTRPRTAAAALAVTIALGACGGAEEGSTVTVLAAASLAEPFTALEARFEQRHPGTEVRLVFGSSATLALQVVEGGPADVLATADRRTMRTVVDAGATAAPPTAFATNRMVLAVPDGNPAGIDEIGDLDREGVAYVACVPSAPCGAIAEDLLAENDISSDPRSYETDVKAVLAKVATGEADAGLVYASDTHARALGTVEVPGAAEHRNPYLLAVLDGAADPDLTEAWVDLVRSDTGRQALSGAGFTLPDAGAAG